MMATSEFISYLKNEFPSVQFYNGTIDKSQLRCVGIYTQGNANPHIAIGGVQNTSYGSLPIRILVHWTESSNDCEQMANSIYKKLFGAANFMIGSRRVISINVLDPCPIDVGRTDKNICEKVIRLTIIYEKEA